MKAKTFLFLFPIFLGLFILFSNKTQAEDALVFPARIFIFHSNSCPHCEEEIEFLEKMEKKYPNLEVYEFEVSRGIKNQSLFSNVIKQYGAGGGVPMTIINDEAIIGFDNEKGIGVDIENQIQHCSLNQCFSQLEEKIGLEAVDEQSKICVSDYEFRKLFESHIEDCEKSIANVGEDTGEGESEKVNIFGKEFSLNDGSSIFVMGIVLGLTDGINPCMFSVLLFLLTYLLAIGSRKKALKAGIAFVIATFLLYFLFMIGIVKVIDVLKISSVVRNIVIVISFVAGLIMIKDFFFYGKWFSLEISDRFKPMMEKLIKKGTTASAIFLALFSGLVELPCTSGLPLAYVTILSSQEIGPFWPLVWYNLFFVFPILVIVIGVSLAWTKVDQIEEKRLVFRKYMRLVAGLLLLFLAIALWKNLI